jgi:HK97 family phage portal protein
MFERFTKAWRMAWGTTRSWTMVLGNTSYPYAAQVGDGTSSSVVMAVVQWICRTFPEAPLRVLALDGQGRRRMVHGHPLAALLEHPNPYYAGSLLWMATLLDWTTAGNAYWLKVRDGAGRVVQIWWAPQRTMEPRWDTGSTSFITHYDYTPVGGTTIPIPAADVVHFRYGLDPQNPRKGLSPLASVLREILTDEEAGNFSAALVRNLGVPGVILAPDGETELMPEDAEVLRAEFRARFTGDRRGEPMILSGRIKAQTLSLNPQELELRTLRRIPEERVSAVLGVPAVVAGLGAGLDRAIYANYREAREAAYESNIVPTQRLFAAEIETQLLGDFEHMEGRGTQGERLLVQFDTSQVRVLQEDENHLATRLATLVGAGILTRDEARERLGL